jgi:hypothetical protein
MFFFNRIIRETRAIRPLFVIKSLRTSQNSKILGKQSLLVGNRDSFITNVTKATNFLGQKHIVFRRDNDRNDLRSACQVAFQPKTSDIS